MKLFKYLVLVIAAMGFVTASPLTAEGHHSARGEERDEDSHNPHEHPQGERTGNWHGNGHEHGHGVAGRGQDRSRYLEELNQKDWEALRDYLETKKTDFIGRRGSDCGLTISGDVRTEWRHLTEKCPDYNGVYGDRRGGNATKGLPPAEPVPLSRNDFDIECNIRFIYKCDRTWAEAHLNFDNSAGIDRGKDCKCDPEGYKGSGNCDSVCLKKAFMGYNAYICGDTRVDVEIGRRNLYNVFDSQIEFLSRFDGIVVKYSDRLGRFSDFYWNTAGFVVDERVNHFAWVTELGLLNICDSGWDLKYSFIDWQKHGRNRCCVRDPKLKCVRNPRGLNYLVSQITTAYHIDKKVFGMPVKLFAAALKNHSGVRVHLTPGNTTTCPPTYNGVTKKNPYGWYVGFIAGEVIKEGDYAFSAQYEWVGATAIPDQDVSGIGNGNVLDYSITASGRGETNYKGFKLEFLYALTDNLSIDAIFEMTREIQKSIGGRHHYSKMEVEAIYAF